MKNIIVLGSSGMLGQAITKRLSAHPELNVIASQRSSPQKPYFFGVESGTAALKQIINVAGGCDYIINCIAILKPQIDEKSSDSVKRAMQVNALFPHELASFATGINARVFHVSTDGVFSGRANEPYYEDSPCDPLDVYGKTKALGEVINDFCVNIRCSLIGTDAFKGKGLFEWLRAQPDGSEIDGYKDHYWNGVSTLQFADMCAQIIRENLFDELRAEAPIHHFSPNAAVSKNELLEIFVKCLSKSCKIKSTSSSTGPLKRILGTRYSVLKRLFGSSRSVEQAVIEMLREIP